MPRVRGQLVQVERSGVRIDACRQCRGVFLDRGELDEILKREHSYVSSAQDDDEDFFREMSGKPDKQKSYGLDAQTPTSSQGLPVPAESVQEQAPQEEHPRRVVRLSERNTDFSLLAIGVLGASTSPPLIAACAAPGLAIAFWRTGAAALVLAPVLLARERRIVLPRGRGLWLALAAGLALAAHFGTFIPSLSYTTVASSAALVCTQPIWAGIIGWFLGERLPGRAWAGVGVCVLGVLADRGGGHRGVRRRVAG